MGHFGEPCRLQTKVGGGSKQGKCVSTPIQSATSYIHIQLMDKKGSLGSRVERVASGLPH